VVKLVAFHLPQFHPIPENDLWWGKGFTEWTNVTKAAPLFEGHYQPHLPSDLGFYDLRLKQSRLAQVELAKSYGISAFCFHYYWFNGKRLLNQPVDEYMADRDHSMSYCLSWANENWTRRWDAAEHEVLISQTYSADSDIAFIDGLLPAFRDPRYLRVDGKPFFMVYRPQHLPNAAATVARWRERCAEMGVGEVHLACALIHGNRDYAQYGFDSGVEFPPHNIDIGSINRKIAVSDEFRGHIFQYEDVANSYLRREYGPGRVFRTVFPSWDNTARTGQRALVILNGTPENYEHWLASTVAGAAKRQDELVFINAWNEWAEGCHLEPDRKHGLSFLEATLRVQLGKSTAREFVQRELPAVPQQEPRSLWRELGALLRFHSRAAFERIKGRLRQHPRLYTIASKTWNALQGRLGT
jgi:lipopolysaccharide biosynthesis protein